VEAVDTANSHEHKFNGSNSQVHPLRHFIARDRPLWGVLVFELKPALIACDVIMWWKWVRCIASSAWRSPPILRPSCAVGHLSTGVRPSGDENFSFPANCANDSRQLRATRPGPQPASTPKRTVPPPSL
jgi:hypothetical protein